MFSRNIDTFDSTRDSITLVNWYRVSNSITRIKNHTSGATAGVKGENRGVLHIQAGHVKDLEHELCHFFAILAARLRCFSQQDWVMLGGNPQLNLKRVVPQLLHVVPIRDLTLFHRPGAFEHSPLRLCLGTHIDIIVVETDHDGRDLRSSNN